MRLGFERTVADLTQPVETDGAGQVVAQFALVEDGGYRNRPSTMKLSHHWPCDDGAKCYGSTQAGRPSPMPKAWRIGSSTMAGVTLGVCLLAFCSGVLAVGNFRMNLGTDAVAMTPLPVVIFQAMDAAGKDGAIRHVMSGVNPQGCQVFSFEHPSATELEHDFLWRTTCDLPERGRIGIFNRSYYEEVLIVRVHRDILLGEGLPDPPHHDKKLWHDRYRSITDLERHLYVNGTRIIKFFLHLSKEEQRKRLLARIDEPDKNWKFSLADIKERGYWKQYMTAYEDCLSATSTRDAPWYVVPADDKENARLIVSRIVLDTFEGLKMTYPKSNAKRRRELQSFRKQLEK
jgi:PPK2 family polyphosphate:nucleotide phosphotransferase